MEKTLVGRLLLDVTNVMASKRSKKEKFQLPVAVRGSRTSVLKLPSSIPVTRSNQGCVRLTVFWNRNKRNSFSF